MTEYKEIEINGKKIPKEIFEIIIEEFIIFFQEEFRK